MDISHYLVQAGIIITKDKERIGNIETNSEKAMFVLMTISSELQVGIVMSFRKILEIMKIHGNTAMRKLSFTIQHEINEILQNKGQF